MTCKACSFVQRRLVDPFIAWCVKYGREDHLVDRDGRGHYMRRWEVIRTPWFGMRLHNTMRPDQDRHLHDHPWWNVSLILKGYYLERLPESQKAASWFMHPWAGVMVEATRTVRRSAGAVVFRRATDRHSLVALSPCVPCWSLFIVGPKRRGWGFHTPQGWVPEATYRQRKGSM